MTCIVAVEAAGSAWLGCDSFLGTSGAKDQIDRPKWVKMGPRFAVAFAGSLRGIQVLQGTRLRKQRRGEDGQAYLVDVANRIHAAFRKHGANIDKDGSSEHDSTFIVALGGKVYTIQDDYSVMRSALGWATAGAGEDYASAALVTLGDTLPPAKRISRALEVASKLSPGVAGPFFVEEIR